MTSTDETTVTLDGDLPLVTVVREFDAPPAKVFRAHADPELFRRWIGPTRLTTEIDRWDCRPGGEWRFVSRDGSDAHAFRGCFHDVRPGELIVQTFTYEGWPDGVSLERVRFEASGARRTRLVATSLTESFELRDAFVASGMEEGVAEGYRTLDDVLTGMEA